MNDFQIQALGDAISSYAFPKKTFDFRSGTEVSHPSMRDLESRVRSLLNSDDIRALKDGLSNVLYWGHSGAGYRDTRVRRFRNAITDEKLEHARVGLCHLHGSGLRSIKSLDLPEFSNMSFTSKIRMFLDPNNFVTLDLKLMRLGEIQPGNLFTQLVRQPTYIPINQTNEQRYEEWCSFCRKLAAQYYSLDIIAVDVERGFFQLIGEDRANEAADILISAWDR